MTILDHIIANKYKEVAAKKAAFPVSYLEKSALFDRETVSMSKALRSSKTGIIAEHKRRSPSKSIINDTVLVQDVAKGYQLAGASGMSVLTDTNYFGGSLDDLLLARAATSFPLLRKEFIVDLYQIVEAKAFGADAILLIAASLSSDELIEFSTLAKSLHLDVLLEVHNQEELDKSLLQTVDMLGVNNRNLKTLDISIDNTISIFEILKNHKGPLVSESGIKDEKDAKYIYQKTGIKNFLIGESLLKSDNTEELMKRFTQIIQ